jgi:hypothetical protein
VSFAGGQQKPVDAHCTGHCWCLIVQKKYRLHLWKKQVKQLLQLKQL